MFVFNLREATRKATFVTEASTPTVEQLQLGCLMRIADALEQLVECKTLPAAEQRTRRATTR